MSIENSPAETDDIAIIGMAGRFPGASDLAKFWRNLQGGVESISRFTEEELLDSGFPLEVIRHPDFVSAKAVLDDADMFDAAFFGISPREAELMDPQHRLLMECAWQALEDAGYDSERYTGRISAFTSTGLNTYLPFNICSHPGLALKVGGFQLSICNDKDFVATRIAYAMNLKGAGVNISTACSSSLVSLHFACQSLLTHQCDITLVGAVTVHFPQKVGHIYEAGAAYSPDGHCRPFDATPSGLIDGNGVATVVLRRLDDALAAGDNIYAVVKGTAVNNDGRLKVGYTAPSIEGQAEVISEALEMAGVDPDTISYVEAHGTATPLGDPIEVEGLTQAFRKGTERTGFCGLGSVKSNIGHVDTAAGLAGLMKIVLGMKHGQLAPSLHFQIPNPKLNLEDSPFYVVGELKEWPGSEHHPRRAGLSSFGVGGTNAHAIIEEAPTPQAVTPSRRHHVLMLSAKTPSALQDAIRNLASHLRSHPNVELADVAYTLQLGRRMFNRRAVVCASSAAEAIAALEDPKRIRTGAVESAGAEVSFMFPGQGSQYPGMAQDLYEREPAFREEIDRCAELLKPELGQDLRTILFAEAITANPVATELHQTALAQPALFAVEYALASLWMSWGIRPAAMIGHSVGEYVAACLAGVFSLPVALSLVAIRGRLMQAMQPGVMLAVSLSEEEVQPLLDGLLEVAAVNSPSTCVVSGPVAAAEKFEARLNERNLAYQRLHTSHAFHSSMMEPVLKPFLEALEKIQLNPPQIPFISNRTGGWISADDTVRPGYWAEHLRHTVRFSAGLKCLVIEAPSILLEVGPGRALTGLARQVAVAPQPRGYTSLPHATETLDDQQFLLATLGELWMSGVPVDWPAYYGDEHRRRTPLPTYPFQRQRYWIEPRKQEVGTRPVELQYTAENSREETDARTDDDTLGLHDRPDLSNEYVAPRNLQESVLAEIWQELLGVSRIGVHDNFFELGGHSLLGTQILARLKQDYGVALQLNALFENQTIAALAGAWLDQRSSAEDDEQLSRLLDALDNMSEADVEVHLRGDMLPAELPGAHLATVAEPEQPEGLVVATPNESGRIFPLVLRPTGAIDLAAWAQENRQYLQRQLTRYGAVLFKGFRIDGTEGFGRVARSLNGDLLSYSERTSPRHEVSDRIFTATDYPAAQSIFLHNENSYAHTIPSKLLFYCRKPAQQGGETPIADCRRVLRRIDPEIVERFIKLKWMYVRNFSDQFGISWQTAFQTTNKEELEAYCRQQDIEYEWTPGDLLRTRQIREAVIHHPHDGTPIWFNHATFFHVTTLEPPVRKVLLDTFAEVDLPNNTYYGDGSSIEPEVIDSLRRAYEEETATFRWEEHDLLLLDNLSTAHSRRPFKGPREILVAMSESVSRSELVSATEGARQTSVT